MKSLLCIAALGAGILTSQAAPRLSADSVPTVGALGNSICRNQYTPMEWGGLIGKNRQWTAFGAFVFFACDGLAIPDIQAFEGHSGKSSSEIVGLMLPENSTEPWGDSQKTPVGVATLKPNITAIISSTNDLLLAPPADVTLGKALNKAMEGLRENIHYVQSVGSIPVVCNIPPIEGKAPLVPWASIPDDLTDLVPTWNAAIKDLCESEDVWLCDVFSACVKADGSNRWKDGFVYRKGAEVEGDPSNAWKIHPSQLASLSIAREALGPVLKKIIGPGCPKVPDADSSSNVAPPANSWKRDFDPQSDSSFEISSSDDGGREAIHFHKPSHEDNRYAQWTSGEIGVTPGQVFLYATSLRFVSCDNLSSLGFSVSDRTPGSASRGQPLAGISIGKETVPTAMEIGKFRTSGFFAIPEGVTKIGGCVAINRSKGGAQGKEDQVILENFVLEPISGQQATKYQPVP